MMSTTVMIENKQGQMVVAASLIQSPTNSMKSLNVVLSCG